MAAPNDDVKRRAEALFYCDHFMIAHRADIEATPLPLLAVRFEPQGGVTVSNITAGLTAHELQAMLGRNWDAAREIPVIMGGERPERIGLQPLAWNNATPAEK